MVVFRRKSALFASFTLLAASWGVAIVASAALTATEARATVAATSASDSSTAPGRNAEARLRAATRLAARSVNPVTDDAGSSAHLILSIRAVTDSAATERDRLETLAAASSGAENQAWQLQLRRLDTAVQCRILEIQRDHAREQGQVDLADRAERALERLAEVDTVEELEVRPDPQATTEDRARQR